MWSLLKTGITLLVVVQLWVAITKPRPNGRVPRGSFGLPVIGETLKYMTSMKTSNPTFMAERAKRQARSISFESRVQYWFFVLSSSGRRLLICVREFWLQLILTHVWYGCHANRFGEMFKSKLMGFQCVIATKGDTIKWVLNREGKQFVASYPPAFKKILGEYTSLASHGDKWKSTRKFIGNSLRIEYLRARVSVVEEQVIECLDTWESKDSVSIREETKTVSNKTISILSV